MGCWNKTCALSNLHIYSGQQVYTFIVEPNDYYTPTGTTTFYRPLLLPFISTYDDYGGGENSRGPMFEFVLNTIKEQLTEVPVGENKYHDIAVSRDNFDEEQLFASMIKQRLVVGSSKLNFTMIRKDIADDILKRWKLQKYVGAGEGTTRWNNSYIEYTLDSVLDETPRLIAHLKDFVKSTDSKIPYIFDALYKFESKLKTQTLLYDINQIHYSRLVNIAHLIFDLINRGDDEMLTNVFETYYKGRFIDAFMYSTRKVWLPGTHEGSQDANIDEPYLLMSAMAKVLKKEEDEQD